MERKKEKQKNRTASREPAARCQPYPGPTLPSSSLLERRCRRASRKELYLRRKTEDGMRNDSRSDHGSRDYFKSKVSLAAATASVPQISSYERQSLSAKAPMWGICRMREGRDAFSAFSYIHRVWPLSYFGNFDLHACKRTFRRSVAGADQTCGRISALHESAITDSSLPPSSPSPRCNLQQQIISRRQPKGDSFEMSKAT